MGITRAIFISSGTIPCRIDKFMIWVSGSETSRMNFFMIVIGMWSKPASLPGRKVFAISANSSWVVGLKNIDCVKKPLRKVRCEDEDFIPLTKLGPML